MIEWPRHKAGLFVTHNEHRDYYEELGQFIVDQEYMDDFGTAEEMEKCIATDELWVIQWYPDTPIGSYRVAGETFEGCIERALRIQKEVDK